MSNSNTEQKSESKSVGSSTITPSPWRCLLGAMISGVFAYGLYNLTYSIAQTFASKPVQSTNPITVNLSVAVRTLVTGLTAMAAGIFGFVAVGLIALGIQAFPPRFEKSAC